MFYPTRRHLVSGLIVVVITSHFSMLAWSAYCTSPVMNEVAYLPAGISHWSFRRFDLYRVNPPLVRMLAALPVLFAKPKTDWSDYSTNELARSDIPVGMAFVKANGIRSLWLYTLARWACIPFSLIGACVCYFWGRDLYGRSAGIVALTLWCFSPAILGNACLLMPDVPAAAMAVSACYVYWKWLRHP